MAVKKLTKADKQKLDKTRKGRGNRICVATVVDAYVNGATKTLAFSEGGGSIEAKHAISNVKAFFRRDDVKAALNDAYIESAQEDIVELMALNKAAGAVIKELLEDKGLIDRKLQVTTALAVKKRSDEVLERIKPTKRPTTPTGELDVGDIVERLFKAHGEAIKDLIGPEAEGESGTCIDVTPTATEE